jgi:hypothetical protein
MSAARPKEPSRSGKRQRLEDLNHFEVIRLLNCAAPAPADFSQIVVRVSLPKRKILKPESRVKCDHAFLATRRNARAQAFSSPRRREALYSGPPALPGLSRADGRCIELCAEGRKGDRNEKERRKKRGLLPFSRAKWTLGVGPGQGAVVVG